MIRLIIGLIGLTLMILGNRRYFPWTHSIRIRPTHPELEPSLKIQMYVPKHFVLELASHVAVILLGGMIACWAICPEMFSVGLCRGSRIARPREISIYQTGMGAPVTRKRPDTKEKG